MYTANAGTTQRFVQVKAVRELQLKVLVKPLSHSIGANPDAMHNSTAEQQGNMYGKQKKGNKMNNVMFGCNVEKAFHADLSACQL